MTVPLKIIANNFIAESAESADRVGTTDINENVVYAGPANGMVQAIPFSEK